MSSSTVLITGGCGFIGTNTALRFSDRGYDVHVFCRNTAQARAVMSDKVHVHEVDICDSEQVAGTVSAVAPHAIVHLAASNIQAGSISSAHDVVATNILGTKHLLNAAEQVGVQSFIGMGSFLEYGVSETPFREDQLCRPPEIYSISKLAQSLLIQSYARRVLLPTTVFRLFTPYGPYIQKGRLIENVIARSLKDEAVHLTSKTVRRDFIYVDDVVDIFFEVTANPQKHTGEIYNLGSGASRSLEEVVRVVQEQTGTKSEFVWGGFNQVAYDTDACTASMDKVFRNFVWRPKTSFEDGIARTIESIRERMQL